MGGDNIALGLIAVLAGLLVLAAISDIRHRSISNPLNGAIALLAIPFWFAIGLDPWPGMVLQIGVALAVIAFFSIFFAFNWMGGGDVKLVTALALWMPWGLMLQTVLLISIIGGALTTIVWAWHKYRKTSIGAGVPYGIAIVLGGLWGLHQQYINHFA